MTIDKGLIMAIAAIEIIAFILIVSLIISEPNKDFENWKKEFNQKWKQMSEYEKQQFISDFKSKYSKNI